MTKRWIFNNYNNNNNKTYIIDIRNILWYPNTAIIYNKYYTQVNHFQFAYHSNGFYKTNYIYLLFSQIKLIALNSHKLMSLLNHVTTYTLDLQHKKTRTNWTTTTKIRTNKNEAKKNGSNMKWYGNIY